MLGAPVAGKLMLFTRGHQEGSKLLTLGNAAECHSPSVSRHSLFFLLILFPLWFLENFLKPKRLLPSYLNYLNGKGKGPGSGQVS